MKTVVSIVLLAYLSNDVLACGRCGQTVCRFAAPVHAAPVVRPHAAAVYVAPVVKAHEYVAPLVKEVPYQDHSFSVTYNLHFPAPVASGATAYGYSPPAVNLLDPALYLNAGSRYLELSQATSQKGFSEFNQSATLLLQQQNASSEKHSQALLLEKIEKLLVPSEGAARAKIDARLRVEGTPAHGEHVGADATAIQAIVTANCVSCHGPTRQNGNLRLDDLATLPERYNEIILKRIIPDDPKDAMPPPASGKRLSFAEKVAFFRAGGFCGKSITPAVKSQPAGR